jgi:hypothetical protein
MVANTALRFEPASNITIGTGGIFPLAITGNNTNIFNSATQTTTAGNIFFDPIFHVKLREHNNIALANTTSASRTLSTLEYLNTFNGNTIVGTANSSGTFHIHDSTVSAVSGTFYYDTTSCDTSRVIKEMIKNTIKSNLLIKVKYKGYDSALRRQSDKEEKARDTLRDMLTEKDWRRYLTNGFIMVRGASGYWYQIFHSYCERVRVYKDGKRVKDICIHTDRTCPPTDHVINMKVLIEMDEAAMWANGNVRDAGYGTSYMAVSGGVEVPEKANLVEKYKQIKLWVTGNNVFSFSDNVALAC